MVHGVCIIIAGVGVLLRGPSGRGKSDLALRLIDEGATLVADDQVELTCDNGGLTATAPAVLRGLLEVRGVGVVRTPTADNARLGLVVDLVDGQVVERMPEPATAVIMNTVLPRIALTPFEASATAKLRLAARAAADGSLCRAPDESPVAR